MAAVAASMFGGRGKTVSPWKDPLLFIKSDESGYLFDPMRPTFIPLAMAASKFGGPENPVSPWKGRENPVSPWKDYWRFSPAKVDAVKKPLGGGKSGNAQGEGVAGNGSSKGGDQWARGESGIRTHIQEGNVI